MKKIENLLLVFVVAFLILYFAMPVVSYGFTDFALVLIVLIALWTLLNHKFISRTNPQQINFQFKASGFKAPGIIILILGVYIVVLPILTSLTIFRNKDYRNLIGNVAIGQKIGRAHV